MEVMTHLMSDTSTETGARCGGVSQSSVSIQPVSVSIQSVSVSIQSVSVSRHFIDLLHVSFIGQAGTPVFWWRPGMDGRSRGVLG